MTRLARARMAVELTVVGSINLDFVARVEHLPRPGETVRRARVPPQPRRQGREPGGRGGAARARACAMIGAVGNDDFADEAMAGLVAAGVELELERRERPGSH